MFREMGTKNNGDLALQTDLVELGQMANDVARLGIFEDYRERKAKNTIRRQDADLALFKDYLQSKGVEVGDLNQDAAAWHGVTWGLVAGFVKWQLKEGYAVGSVNVRLSTVKTYAKLAFKAGALGAEDYATIKAVEGYKQSEKRDIDERRVDAGIPTRRSTKRGEFTDKGEAIKSKKKGEAVTLDDDQAERLKVQPDTPQGRRDALLMCLLIDHGLRVSEVVLLTSGSIDLKDNVIRFYRPKTKEWTNHYLTTDTRKAAELYLKQDALPSGPLLRRSHKAQKGKPAPLLEGGLSIRAINKRVTYLGDKIGIDGLSPHDCRHYAATYYADPDRLSYPDLMDFFGWKSTATPKRYIESKKVQDPGK